MRTQRGAISVIAAATLVVAVLTVALALDIGRIILERQRLQGAVDAAALAGARALAVEGNPENARAAAREAAQQNGFTATLADGAIEVGRLRVNNGLRQFEAGTPYTAVRVTAARSVPRSLFAGGLLPGQAELGAQALAYQESEAAVQIGSSLLDVNLDESLLLNAVLGDLLGDQALNLSVADYNALLDAQVKLGDLLAGLRIGSADAIASTQVNITDLLSVAADVLTADDPATMTLAQLALNNRIITKIAAKSDFALGDLLVVSGGGTLDARLNVLELIKASAQVVNQSPDNLIDVDLTTAGTLLSGLGLGGLKLQLGIVQAPQIAIGPPGYDPQTGEPYTKARTGQVNVGVKLDVLNLPSVLELLVSDVVVKLDLAVASAEAELVSITPATLSDASTVEIAANAKPADLDVDVSAKLLSLLGGGITVSASASASVGSTSAQVLAFDGPFVPALDSPSDANTETLGNQLGISIQNLRLRLAGVTVTLGNLLGGLLDPLVEGLLAPLLELLGLQIGGADVTVLHASAGQVRLAQ
jgi:uncharacterized membrane protein